MKTSKLLLCFALFILGFNVQSATLAVNWQDFDSYTDVKRDEIYSKSSYHHFIKSELLQTLTEEAKKLPGNQTLKLVIMDIDLAGWIDPRLIPNRVRVITRQKPAFFKLSYQLVADNVVVKQGEVELDDKGFQPSLNSIQTKESFYYEKEMLKSWFKTTF